MFNDEVSFAGFINIYCLIITSKIVFKHDVLQRGTVLLAVFVKSLSQMFLRAVTKEIITLSTQSIGHGNLQ